MAAEEGPKTEKVISVSFVRNSTCSRKWSFVFLDVSNRRKDDIPHQVFVESRSIQCHGREAVGRSHIWDDALKNYAWRGEKRQIVSVSKKPLLYPPLSFWWTSWRVSLKQYAG